jgi:hypothetical protein
MKSAGTYVHKFSLQLQRGHETHSVALWKCIMYGAFYLLRITSSTTSSHLCYVLLQNSPYFCLHTAVVPIVLFFFQKCRN